MPQLKNQLFTVEDIYKLPDGQRAELIDGKLYNVAPPSRIHQKIVSRLTQVIGHYISTNEGACEVYPAPLAVFLNADEETYVEPDISVICDLKKLSDRGCEGAPDLIIEVVSPSSRRMDYSKKNALYSDAGVQEYWIVDSEKERTTVYRYEEDAAPVIVPFDQLIQVGIYSDLSITISEILK